MRVQRFRRWVAGVFGQRKPAERADRRRAVRLGVDRLEAREVPVANLFVDFGTALPAGGLQTTVGELQNSFATGGLQGPNLAGLQVNTSKGTVTLTAGDPIRVLPFGIVVPPFDYDGNGTTNAADTTALQNDIVSQVAGHYGVFDINVSQVANGSVAGVRSQMQANNGLTAKKNDAYALVGGYFYPASDGFAYSIGAAAGALGVAPSPDITSGSNLRDDTVAIFAENLANFGVSQVKQATAFVTTHEAGHAFGLRHTSRSTSDNRLLNGNDIMTTGGGSPSPTQPTRADNFFTRFPLPYAESWPDGATTNAHDRLANDSDIGLRSGAAAFVTGTGANDDISFAPSGSGVTVTVRAYRDPARTQQIGLAYSYNIPSLANGIRVEAGAGDDVIYVPNFLMPGAVTVIGGTGTDTLATFGSSATTENVDLVSAPAPTTGGVGFVRINSNANRVFFDSTTDLVNYSTEGGTDTVYVDASGVTPGTTTFTVLKGTAGGFVTVATYGDNEYNHDVSLAPAVGSTLGTVTVTNKLVGPFPQGYLAPRPIHFDAGVDKVNYSTKGSVTNTVYTNPSLTNTFTVLKEGTGPVVVATYGTTATDTVNLKAATATQLGNVDIGGGHRLVHFDAGVVEVNYSSKGGNDTVYLNQPSTTNTFFVRREGASGVLTLATFGLDGVNDKATITAAPTSGGFGTVTLDNPSYKPVKFDRDVDQINFDGRSGDDLLYVDNVGSPRRFGFFGGSGFDTLRYRNGWRDFITAIEFESESPY